MESLLHLVQALVFASTRLFALFLVFSMLESGGVKGVTRISIVFGLGMIIVPQLIASMPAQLDVLDSVRVLTKEVMLGALMGYFANQLFWAVQSVGALIDQQTGVGMAAVIDPVLRDQEGPTPGMLNQLLINVMLASGGFLGLLGAVFDSFRVWPVFSDWPSVDEHLASLLLTQWSSFTELIVRWAAPVLMALMVVELGLGLLQRYLTTLNVFYFSQCIKIMVAVFMLVLIIASSWETIAGAMPPERMVRWLLRVFGG